MVIKSAYGIYPGMAEEPDYKAIIPDANMRRRMSRIVKMGVASALECMRAAGGLRPDGVIAATSLGCLADTEKFLAQLLEREEAMLNPSSFIYSTFNTVSGQIALMAGLKNYNMTYTAGGNSFADALMDARLCLEEGMDNVLVVAFDETIPAAETIFERIGQEYIQDAEAYAFILSGAGLPEGPLSTVRRSGAGNMAASIASARALFRACRKVMPQK